MEFNWQTFAAIAVVTLACGHLVRRGLAVWSGTSQRSCGGCAKCVDAAEQKTVVEIRDLSKPVSRDS